MGSLFLGVLGLVLLGYALFGRGFAEVGLAPLYVGEATVALGVFALVLQKRRLAGVRSITGVLLVLLVLYSVARASLDVPTYALDTVRDLALIYYGIIAVVVGTLLFERRDRLVTILSWFRRFAFVFPPLALAVWWYTLVSDLPVPAWPGSGVPMVRVKAGDTMVHASGIVAFIAIFGRHERARLPLQMLALGALALFGMSMARAGMLSFFCALGMLVLLKAVNWRLVATLVVIVGFVWGFSAVAGRALALRDVEHSASWGQLVENVRSVADIASGTNLESDLAGPAIWRLLWWSSIARYTLGGEYFWMGKGFGLNLADDDGFQTLEDGSLRSPHNAHMTVLARMGVPGALIWLAFHLAWFATVWGAIRRAGREDALVARAGRVVLVYWTAMLVNASFDVYLEGPMGGIWYWAVIGVGLSLPSLVSRPQAVGTEPASAWVAEPAPAAAP